MIDHDHRIAVRHQIAHHAQQTVHIRRMQADRRLVQHIQHARRTIAHRTRQLDTLTLTGRQRRTRTIQRQIPQAELQQTTRHIKERFADSDRHRTHRLRKPLRHRTHPGDRIIQRHRRRLRQTDTRHLRGTRPVGQTRPRARTARPLLQKPGHALQPLLILRLRQRVLHRIHRVEIGEIQLREIITGLGPVQNMPLDRRPLEHDMPLLIGQLTERDVRTHAHRTAHLLHQIPHERTPRQHRTVIDRLRLIRHQRGTIHLAHHTRTRTRRTRTTRIERQILRARTKELLAAAHATDRQLRRHVQRRLVTRAAPRTHMRTHTRKQQTQRIQQLAHRAERRTDPRHRRPLMQRQRRRHMPHIIHLRTRRLRQPTPRIRRQRLQIPTRPLRIQHPQRQRTLPRPGHAGNPHQLTQWNIDIQILEIMHTRATHLDMRRTRRTRRQRRTRRLRRRRRNGRTERIGHGNLPLTKQRNGRTAPLYRVQRAAIVRPLNSRHATRHRPNQPRQRTQTRTCTHPPPREPIRWTP